MSTSEKIKIVGYWNGSINDPEISFNIPTEESDTRKLVVIELQCVEDNSRVSLKNTLEKANREVDKLSRVTQRLRTQFK